jgi:hypothetical protein
MTAIQEPQQQDNDKQPDENDEAVVQCADNDGQLGREADEDAEDNSP